ncbi:MAG: GNAT family N-acetyltransferase, partial [Candidatus Heimdallarchaeota archaeon]|nr:GNAT family N-acetyltransferase [Candidatus Heimdallarchaeota archaeon]
MEIDIVRFNATTATEDDWKKYHIFRKLRYKETNPEDPMTPDSLIEKAFKMQENHPEMDGERYVIYETGQLNKIIGNLTLMVFRETSASYKGNEQISQFELALLPEYRRMGIGTQVMKMAYEFVKQKGRSIMITNTSEASGRAFLNKIGGTEALSGVENRLDLGQVDWTELKNWSKEGAIRARGVTLKTFNLVPDEIIDEYCRIYTETMNQQPFGDLEISDLVTTPESLRLRENQFKEMGGSSIIYI